MHEFPMEGVESQASKDEPNQPGLDDDEEVEQFTRKATLAKLSLFYKQSELGVSFLFTTVFSENLSAASATQNTPQSANYTPPTRQNKRFQLGKFLQRTRRARAHSEIFFTQASFSSAAEDWTDIHDRNTIAQSNVQGNPGPRARQPTLSLIKFYLFFCFFFSVSFLVFSLRAGKNIGRWSRFFITVSLHRHELLKGKEETVII